MAFGFLFCQLGYGWYYAPLMSLFSEAASAQFLALPLLSEKVNLLELTLMALLINLRHVFYGLSLLRRYSQPLWQRIYLIFGLTDETYSIVTSTPEQEHDTRFCLMLTALNHSYWVIGTAIGAAIGSRVKIHIPGIEFMLTCLFVVLVIEQALRIRKRAPFIIALVCALLAGFFFPGQMLFIAILLSAMLLIIHQKMTAQI